MSLSPTGSDRRAQGAFGTACEPALGGFPVDQEPAPGRQIVCRARAVGALLLSHHQQQIDALLPVGNETVSRYDHRRSDALGVRRTAAVESFPLESGRKIWRDCIEV